MEGKPPMEIDASETRTGTGAMVWVNRAEVDSMWLLSPLYTATIECDPGARAEVV